MAPASFAAAAQNAGATSTRDDWPRRPNGATQTFRRSSASTSMPSTTQQDPSSAQAPPRYVPPHRNGTVADTRYSKDQLLDLFKAQQASDGGLSDGLPSLYVGGWQPDISNGAASAGWGRTDHSRDGQPGPDICWDGDGTVEPLGLVDMSEDERELFSTSVNTPLKPPSTANKDGQASNGLPGRKVSLSGQTYSPGAFGPLSPTASRAPGRRRDTSESYPFPSTNPLASPTSGFSRDDQRAPSPPASLTRRRTDLKDLNTVSEKDVEGDEKATSTPFGSLRRNPTGPLSAGFGAPSSPWSNAPQSAGLSPMGSFGSFGLGQQATPTDKRPGLGSGRAESRFKNLLNKDSVEEPSTRSVERKASVSSLSRVNENESWRPQPAQEPSTAPVDELEEDLTSGSGFDSDVNPQNQYQQAAGRGFGTPSRVQSRDDFGFGAFGMTSDNAQGFGQSFMQGQQAYQQTPAQQQRELAGREPMSPTDTNPYKSPEQHGIDRLNADMEGDHDDMHAQLPGLGAFGGDQHQQQFGGLGGLGGLPSLGRMGGPQAAASDRSQTNSATGNRGFAGLGGLGQMGGHPGANAWPASQGGFGAPGRPTAGLSNAFGGGIFSTSMAETQSPGLAGLGSPGMFGPQSGTAFGGRGPGLFSPASQEQMRQAEQQRDISGDRGGQPPFSGHGEAFGAQHEQDLHTEYPSGQFGAPGQHSATGQSAPQQAPQGQQQAGTSQPPAPQQRTMVMPDRMRWIYKDPSGNMQGPWTGLEMHDWYKAGFFSPELLVKKFEDPEYEPLAQLIRRIGNSREPFLVPQIGIPHGQTTAPSAAPPPWTSAPSTTSTGPTSTAAQPPFASSFPSFGTTLTAEQQNALERRKQEEQYLMARQKEHLAQQQIAQRIQHQQHGASSGMQQQGGLMPGGGQLQHHSSAQSLHSQPSFGSMTSPPSGPFQPSPTQAAQAQGSGLFDQSYRGGQSGGLGAVGAGVDTLGHIREEEIPGIMDRLNLGNQTQGQFGAPGQPFAGQQMQSPSTQEQHERQVQQVLQDRARLQQEQTAYDAQQARVDEQPTQNERLQQFQQLQGQAGPAGLDARFQPAISKPMSDEPSSTAESSVGSPARQPEQHEMSLKERIQQTQSNQQSPAPQQPGLPQPFPPAPSQSPLPAPAAQRTGRTSVADQLQTEQRDLSQTPSVETPSAVVAPWAKEPAEAQKGPSLKEIQAMEAKKAAELEELAAANRRAAFQREMEAQAQTTTIPPAPGLPASASWGAAASPATPTGNTASAWAKAAQKPTAAATAKGMAQIQKEEEARKRKLAAAAAQAQAAATGSIPAPAVGKSYANLAGKISTPTAPSPNAPGSAWTTVGAGGKPKTPAAPPAAPTPTRSASTTMASAQAAANARKAPARAPSTNNGGGVNAQEELKKWAIGELRPDLNKGYSADDIVNSLIQFPADLTIITEVIHGASSTIDSRHFAEEWLRRKKLADKGLVDTSAPLKSASPAGANADQSGGWNEVAKKGGKDAGGAGGAAASPVGAEQGNGAFRVVPAKKKGGRR